MKQILKQFLRRIVNFLIRYVPPTLPEDVTDAEKEILKAVEPYTWTSTERVVALIRATEYVVNNNIKGDFVECGVWRGGSSMAVAYTLKRMGAVSRKLYLYDTFSGMVAAGSEDIRARDGTPAADLLALAPKDTGIWCYASRPDVEQNMNSTGYPTENIFYVEGKVEDTIPTKQPEQISLLRLDTDWYESTKHELTHLYPRLVKNGILIIDDYGHWTGAKQATDEYFSHAEIKPHLHRVDYTGRLVVKH